MGFFFFSIGHIKITNFGCSKLKLVQIMFLSNSTASSDVARSRMPKANPKNLDKQKCLLVSKDKNNNKSKRFANFDGGKMKFEDEMKVIKGKTTNFNSLVH
jgi:hypothetical protein